MKNLALYTMSTFTYFVIYAIVTHHGAHPVWTVTDLKVLGLIALLCSPVNIGGNVFTVIGNAQAEKSIYSICSLYQKAGRSAWNLVGFGCLQDANQHAVTILGFTLCQVAGWWAVTGVGVALYQSAGDCGMGIGVTLYQSAVTSAIHFIGVTVWQEGNLEAGIFAGFAGYQYGKQEALALVGMAVYQATSAGSRTFAALKTSKA